MSGLGNLVKGLGLEIESVDRSPKRAVVKKEKWENNRDELSKKFGYEIELFSHGTTIPDNYKRRIVKIEEDINNKENYKLVPMVGSKCLLGRDLRKNFDGSPATKNVKDGEGNIKKQQVYDNKFISLGQEETDVIRILEEFKQTLDSGGLDEEMKTLTKDLKTSE